MFGALAEFERSLIREAHACPTPTTSLHLGACGDIDYTAQRSALAKNMGFGLREKPVAAVPHSAGTIEAIAAEPKSIAESGAEPASVADKRKAVLPREATAWLPRSSASAAVASGRKSIGGRFRGRVDG
jgi:hypothetical protein